MRHLLKAAVLARGNQNTWPEDARRNRSANFLLRLA
jgi:hypothetical protein